MTTFILAIDGGGIRGIIPAYILSEIEEKMDMKSHKLFNVIGGTSTGGIIAAALSTPKYDPNKANKEPYSAKEILKFYMKESDKIFVPQCTWFSLRAKYKGKEGIESFLKEKIGDITLSEARDAITHIDGNRLQQMFMTGYTINSSGGRIKNPMPDRDFGPYLFAWNPLINDKLGLRIVEGDNYFVREGARATSAAPTYFPVAHVGGGKEGRSDASERYVVDGGVMSNNPAIWGLSEIVRLNIPILKPIETLEDQDKIVVISLGTGQYKGANGLGINNNTGLFVPSKGNWGGIPWMLSGMYDLMGLRNDSLSLLDIVLDSVPQVASDQLKLLGQRFGFTSYRFEPDLPKDLMKMDEGSKEHKDALEKVAEDYLGTVKGKGQFNAVITKLKESFED